MKKLMTIFTFLVFLQFVAAINETDTDAWINLDAFKFTDDMNSQLKTVRRCLKCYNKNIKVFQVHDKASKFECEVANTLWCLEWRCGIYQQHLMAKHGLEENERAFHLCESWIALNKFLAEWFLPAIRSV